MEKIQQMKMFSAMSSLRFVMSSVHFVLPVLWNKNLLTVHSV